MCYFLVGVAMCALGASLKFWFHLITFLDQLTSYDHKFYYSVIFVVMAMVRLANISVKEG